MVILFTYQQIHKYTTATTGTLTTYYKQTTSTLQIQYMRPLQHTTGTLTTHCKHTTNTLQAHYKHTTSSLLTHCKHTTSSPHTNTLQAYYKQVKRSQAGIQPKTFPQLLQILRHEAVVRLDRRKGFFRSLISIGKNTKKWHAHVKCSLAAKRIRPIGVKSWSAC